jgi:hypothetical protein
MKNRTLVLLLFLVVLITAFAFRWVEGPIQTDDKLEIVHLKDRWMDRHGYNGTEQMLLGISIVGKWNHI